MAEPQLSVRSAKARELAHRLARYERRSVAEVVERALEMYQARQLGHEPARAFYERLARDCATDVDLEALVREERKPHTGIDL
ncbi:type II toxin-antitoxin system VapB family antitoxin [Thiocapsa bogorovii]|uniref:type II toxin-antitoxin system VapB family antitoxin n=1 Tax=Thiocapsa bogorovii TaxID=521689 RepID=UPI001E54213E|nr:type II toxin-antitoxin system VapB family antitoxin [Thiocapsa bogorovii]UHD17947.1 type II toxin-antitoxin system VapB family antitoxin [Thiocapsa bogorovii]